MAMMIAVKAVGVAAQVANVAVGLNGLSQAAPQLRNGFRQVQRSFSYQHGVVKRDCRRYYATITGTQRQAADIKADFVLMESRISAALSALTDIDDINEEKRDMLVLSTALATYLRKRDQRKKRYRLRMTALESNQAGNLRGMQVYADEYQAVSGETLIVPTDVQDMFDTVGQKYHEDMTSQQLQFGEHTLCLQMTPKRKRDDSDDFVTAKRGKFDQYS